MSRTNVLVVRRLNGVHGKRQNGECGRPGGGGERVRRGEERRGEERRE